MNISSPIGKRAQWVFPIVIALFFQALALLLSQFREPIGFAWYGLLWSVLIVFAMWEIGRRVGHRYTHTSYHKSRFWRKTAQQFLLASALQMLAFDLSFIGINFYENYVLGHNNPLSIGHILMSSTFSIVISLLINTVQIGYQVVYNWQQAQLKANAYKHEVTIANLESLKQQLDPHFMFNNFSTLHGLIYEDQEKAGDYLLKLADVYRQVLGSLSKTEHQIKDELAIALPYIDLLQIRYGQHLKFEMHIPESCHELQLAVMGLQIAIENAIKHNRIDAENPLSIQIQIEGNSWLSINNNLQPRSSMPSSNGIGLSNLNARCEHACGQSINIAKTKQQFSIKIPLWKKP